MKQSRITNILSYFLRRAILCIPVIFGVIIITFFITRAVPGDPVLRLLPEKFTAEMYEREKARIGLDKPLIIQFIVYMIDVLRGNWGYSIGVFPRSEVWNMIFQWLPRSLEIMFLSMFIAAFIGIKLGKISASHRNKPSDYTIRSFSYVGMSVPMFVIGYFLIIFCLATGIKIFPFYGYKSPGIGNPPTITHSRIIDCIISGNFYMLFDYGLHLFLPMIGITIGQLVLISRQTRGSLISILQTDYIRTARAKGLSAKIILKRHALRNAFIPTISSIMLGFPKVLGGYVAVEVVFDLKGIGQMFYMSLIYNDYNLMIALIYIFALVVIIFSLIGEFLYAVIDPRIKYR